MADAREDPGRRTPTRWTLPVCCASRDERHKREAEAERENEPDQPHRHLGRGRLAGSLAEGHYAHQRPAPGRAPGRGPATLFDHAVSP